MRTIAQIISWLSLVALTVPSILYLTGSMELDAVKKIMLIASAVWFLSATPWMWNEKSES